MKKFIRCQNVTWKKPEGRNCELIGFSIDPSFWDDMENYSVRVVIVNLDDGIIIDSNLLYRYLDPVIRKAILEETEKVFPKPKSLVELPLTAAEIGEIIRMYCSDENSNGYDIVRNCGSSLTKVTGERVEIIHNILEKLGYKAKA